MIAVCDTSACSLRPKVHAEVSQTAIMGRICRRGNAGPHSEREAPQRNTRSSHSRLRIVTRRELDVALGVIGPTAGFRGAGLKALPDKITESDTQSCTLAQTCMTAYH